MSQISVFDMTGKKVADTELNDAIFGIEPNKAIMHAMVVNYLANQRQGTQSTLTRTEVRGGGRKPWRQKGTGHARLNKKERRLGMKSALSTKVVDENLVVVDSIKLESYKTKAVVEMLKALGAEGKALIVTAESDKTVVKSAANIPGVKTATVNTLSVYDILNYDKFIVSSEAVKKIEEVYA